MIHPGRYYAAIVAAAQRAGVDLHTGTPALRIEVDGPSRVVRTARGDIRAGAVLIATNGYTDGLVPWIHDRVMPIGSYIIATEPMSEELAASISPRGRCFFDTKNFLYYWHVNAERRLIFGGRASFRRTTADQTGMLLRQALAHGPSASCGPAHRPCMGRQDRVHLRSSAPSRRAPGHPLCPGLLRQRPQPCDDLRAADGRHPWPLVGGGGHTTGLRACCRCRAHRSSRPHIAADPGSCPRQENGSGSRTGGAAAGHDPSMERHDRRATTQPTRAEPGAGRAGARGGRIGRGAAGPGTATARLAGGDAAVQGRAARGRARPGSRLLLDCRSSSSASCSC